MVALHDLEPDAWDRQESLGEARALAGEPEPCDDVFWFHIARGLLAPLPATPTEEIEF